MSLQGKNNARRSCLQGPDYIWVDNSAVCGNLLKKIFPTVKNVLEDLTHLMRRYMRTLTPGHPLNRKSLLLWGNNLWAAFFFGRLSIS